jgi:hypothetical protein
MTWPGTVLARKDSGTTEEPAPVTPARVFRLLEARRLLGPGCLARLTASERATDTARGSSRTRHRDTSRIWLPVNDSRASKPKSLIRSRAVNPFTVLVRSVVIE